MKHLITPNDLSDKEVEELFEDARIFQDLRSNNILEGKLVVTLFFESSTRTRSSFEIAAKRLGAEVVNLEVQTSSTNKGETVEDTVANLNAMKPDAIIIRHKDCGLPASLKTYVDCPIINAGDGKNAHPTQALLDLFTIDQHFEGNIQGKNILIVGDIVNSRVATSNLELLPRFGLNPILVSPPRFQSNSSFRNATHIKEVIDDADIIMSLRVQHERHEVNISKEEQEREKEEYVRDYCITKELVGDRDFLLLHPGPVNRNIDITDEMLNDPRSKVLKQVENGVAIRMAVLKKFILQKENIENKRIKVKSSKGFSLIELIFAIAVIAVIASVAIPKLMGVNSKAKTSTVNGDISTIISSVQSYHMIHKKVDKISDSVTLNPTVWSIADKEVIFKENDKECVKIVVSDSQLTVTIDQTSGDVCSELYNNGVRNEVFALN